ncbi:beta-glucosidase [Burkholderia gladioli]|uniref:beta-glucosidase n=1 Tax=Burkholderia gladioli TaxID=28095 RepID=UPI00163F7ACA|nr:beta-glucosidase [Burkholderia gladioli]
MSARRYAGHAMARRRGRLVPQPFFPLLACLLALLWPLVCRAQLRGVDATGGLHGVPGEPIVLRYEASVADAQGATLSVEVFAFDDTGRPAPTPIATVYRAIGAGRTQALASVPVSVTRPGFYRADAELSGRSGARLGRATTSFAMAAPRPGVGLPDFGVVTHFAQAQGAPSVLLPLVRQAGFSWIRDELYWQEIEKTPGRFRFPPAYDAYLRQAVRLGISPLVVLDYGNAGAYPKLFGASAFPQTPEARALFVRYVSGVVKRYGDLVHHWELWNEPSFEQIGYANYLALLKASYAAIKALSPGATVLACGGGGTGGGPGGDCPIELIEAGGLEAQDGFSVHPYMSPNTPEYGYPAKGGPIDTVSIPTTWPYLQSVAARHPRRDGRPLQVWVTEFGWPVNPKVPGQDEASQAGNLVRSYLLSRRANAVRVLFWYDLMDDGTDPNNIEHNFGLLHHDMSPKPAFLAAAVLSATLCQRPWHDAPVDSGEIKVYRYGSGDDAVLAGWTVGTAPGVASIRLRPGRYIQRDWQGVESPVTVTSQPFEWILGPLPRYLLAVRDTG